MLMVLNPASGVVHQRVLFSHARTVDIVGEFSSPCGYHVNGLHTSATLTVPTAYDVVLPWPIFTRPQIRHSTERPHRIERPVQGSLGQRLHARCVVYTSSWYGFVAAGVVGRALPFI